MCFDCIWCKSLEEIIYGADVLLFYSIIRYGEGTIVVDVVRKLDIPIDARVSVFANVIYPVLNNSKLSFTRKWITGDKFVS